MGLWKKYYEYPKKSKERNILENFFNGVKIDTYDGIFIYSGKSSKIKKGNVTIIEDKGDKCKVQDIKGNIAIVAKSQLQTMLKM